MKRSEFLRQIENYLYFHTEAREEQLSDIANGLLELIEDAGLKAPLTKKCPVLHTTKHVWKEENGTS